MHYLEEAYDLPGMRLAQYLSFRTLMAGLTAGIVGWLLGPHIIRWLQKKAIAESIRQEGPQTHAAKQGTPTMGGILIGISLVVGVLLWGELTNAYLWALLGLAIWLGGLGFLDDWLKKTRNKQGLPPRLKLAGQAAAALWLTLLMLTEPSFYTTREHVRSDGTLRMAPILREVGFQKEDRLLTVEEVPFSFSQQHFHPLLAGERAPTYYRIKRGKDTITIAIPPEMQISVATKLFGQQHFSSLFRTNLPFVKSQEIVYGRLGNWQAPPWLQAVIYGLVLLFILTATSNAFNLTDGLDGLAIGVGGIAFVSLGVFAYFSSNRIWADYFMILYLPYASEVTVFCGAMVGTSLAFLWYNAYPAQVFMGDTGSLMIGGLIGAIAMMIKKELLLPLIAGVSFAETLSVMLQVAYFRYTKRKYGQGRRIFRMSPLHHHYELGGWHEVKVVIRFWIIALLLNALAFITLKLR
ncbi:MAG: phospho-N-acetylmuramoyl-pentapeptide-transferase [Bacteroidia bacterium]|nr:phospho-N-acetylmuramoyl-pentapeptide-transferase [Bacteroidia bacterium]MDW8134350.1 phospho-N-acetylmuramoyl-pentapeptide-transferase [Bacteroidia bacterium]